MKTFSSTVTDLASLLERAGIELDEVELRVRDYSVYARLKHALLREAENELRWDPDLPKDTVRVGGIAVTVQAPPRG